MSYYHGLISSRKANSILDVKGEGSFLIRDSQSQPGSFVLSARSGGRVYHVLIFHHGGQFQLDSAVGGREGEGEENPVFRSLDDLVVFLMAHDLKVEGNEVHFVEAVTCVEENPRPMGSPSRKAKAKDDSDALTDLFATLFGRKVSILSIAHSRLSMDGQDLEGKEYLGVVARDATQKGFFIKIVDPKEKKVLGEKRVTRSFQYDTPGDLVMTYLSEHGITCIGFRDVWERERFLHQVDRVVRLQQDKGVRLRARGDSDARHIEAPNEMTHRIKASNFNIHKITSEWQYLFDLAGVTRPMLEDPATLQFILDTVYQLGGAPTDMECVRQEALSSDLVGKGSQGQDVKLERKKEVMEALAIDHALRRESLRASKLSDELKKKAMKRDIPISRAIGCAYKAACERYKDQLMLKHSMFALGPELSTCFCEACVAGQPVVQVSGAPPQQYSLPVRWCQFVHRSQSHRLSQRFRSRWHAAYCCVPCSRVAGVLRTGQLPQSYSTGEIRLSPDIQWATHMASITPERYYDDVTDRHYRVSAAFQVYIQPETYTVCAAEAAGQPSPSPLLHAHLEWRAREQTYTIHAFLIQMAPSD